MAWATSATILENEVIKYFKCGPLNTSKLYRILTDSPAVNLFSEKN